MAPHIQEIIFGAGRVIDIGTTLSSRINSQIIFDDNEAITKDWQTVGQDIRDALNQYEEERNG